MAGFLKGLLIGNLGRDPEIRYLQDGKAVCNFSVAATKKVKGQDVTQWVKVAAFGKLAEICGQYLTKGKQVYCEGDIELEQWQDNEGNPRSNLKMVCFSMQMLGSKADQQQQGNPNPGAGYQGGPPQGGYGPPQGQGGYGAPPGGYAPPNPQGRSYSQDMAGGHDVPEEDDDIPF